MRRHTKVSYNGAGTLGPLNRLLGHTTVPPLPSAEEGDMEESAAPVLPLLIVLLEVLSVRSSRICRVGHFSWSSVGQLG